MEPLVCEVADRGAATVVHVRGEVDLATAPALREALIGALAKAPVTHLVVDLTGVRFIDSTGLGVLAAAHQRLVSRAASFTVVVATPTVRRVLQVCGLLQAWRVTSSVEEAVGG